MKKPVSPGGERSELRDRIIGLGEQSFRKSYFPQLQTQLQRLERFRTLFDHAQEGIYLIDGANGAVIDTNRMGAALLGLEVSTLLNTIFAEHFPDPERHALDAVASDPAPGVHTMTLQKTDAAGQTAWQEFSINTVILQEQRYLLVLGRDVTDRHRADEDLRASLREKEALLREIHHRVKNNLQIISSLLHLQAEECPDPSVQTAFQESQSRVRSMALIHERLYRSRDFSGINFREYLPTVMAELLHTYGRTDIELVTGGEDVHLAIDTAIPCGLIVSELVSNALKHAFPRGRRGTITVEMRMASPDNAHLRVSDDGAGFPAHLDLRATRSMGLTLVLGLVEQLDGTIALDRTAGSCFTITFPLPAPRPL